MMIVEVLLEEIDLADERFRVSEELDVPELERSLGRVGLLSPVHLLVRRDSRPIVICGFRRLRALGRLGQRSVFARVWKESECSELSAFEKAVWDNLAHRKLSGLEIARALFSFVIRYEVPQDRIVGDYLPVLGLAPHKNVLHGYLALHNLSADLRRMFSEGRITLASALRLSGMDADIQQRMAGILSKVRWSASLQRETLDLTEELSAIWRCRWPDVFDRDEIASLLHDDSLSPARRGEQIRILLHRWRNPRISSAEEQFQRERVKLGLPSQVQVSPDPYFESRRVHIEFDVSSADGFRKMADALRSAAQSEALERLFGVV